MKKNWDNRPFMAHDDNPLSLGGAAWIPAEGMVSPTDAGIHVVCDSEPVIEELARDTAFSADCKTVRWADVSAPAHTAAANLNRPFYIFIATDTPVPGSEPMKKIMDVQPFASGVLLISPKPVIEVPCSCATTSQEIVRTIRAWCLLMQREGPSPVSFGEIHKLLLNKGGEIRCLSYSTTDSAAVEGLPARLTEEAGESIARIESYIIHVSIPPKYKNDMDSIVHAVNLLRIHIRQTAPQASGLVGTLFETSGSPEACISIFMH